MITFRVPLPPRGLRRNSETTNRGYRSKLQREYQEQVWCAGRDIDSYGLQPGDHAWQPWERATVHYHWHSIHQTDEDNIIASMKPALDVLKSTGPRPLSIIVDDAGAVVTATWVKASRRSDEQVLIVIERIA